MKKAKLLSLLLAGSLLFHTAGIDALATAPADPALIGETAESGSSADISAEDTSGQVSEDDGESKDSFEDEGNAEQPSEKDDENKNPSEDEGNTEQPSEDDGESNEPSEDESNVEQPSEDEELTDDALSSEDSVSENSISENTLPEEDTEADIFSIFPGLGDNYTFSSQQLADKRTLSAHVGDVVKVNAADANDIEDYPDAKNLYELGEVVYLAETQAEAEQVAEAFGGTLDSYSYEVAVISLPKKATVALAIAAAADPDVKLPAVWPNYYNYLDSETNVSYTTNDPEFSKQWQHDYIGTRYAWAAGFKGQGIKVAVIDTGLQKSNEDIPSTATGKNFVDGATGDNYTVDNQTHGTHVAGIIAATANNNKGGAGIAPEATVCGYCVFPAKGGASTSDVIRAIEAAVKDGNDIINMSLGGPMYHDPYATAVKKAYEAGVAIFASSGNDDTNGNNFPAAYTGTISVGAVDQNSAKAAFSNYGSTVNLSFPGVGIYSTTHKDYTDEYGTKYAMYGYMSGTSQASPAAAGTAAVILSARDDIQKLEGKKRVDTLLSVMKSSTTKCTTSGMGAGTTYLPGVLKIATDMTVPDAPVIEIDDTKYTKGKNGKDYIAPSVNVTLSTKTAVGVDIYYSTDGKTPAYKNGQIINAASTTPYKLGDAISLSGAKSVTIKALAVNPISGKASKVVSKTFTLTPNPSDVTIASADGVTQVVPGKSLKLTATVTPSYAISTKVVWSVVDSKGVDAKDKGVTVSSSGAVSTKATKAVTTPAEEYTVTATATGSDGNPLTTVKGTYKFTVKQPEYTIKKVAFLDKETNKPLKAQNLATSKTLDLKEYLTVTVTDAAKKDTDLTGADAAKEVVWSSSNKTVATVANGVITAKAPGKAVIKAISNDGGNKSATYNVTVVQPVTKITVSGPNKVAVGKGVSLTATVEPANATNKKVIWTVDDVTKATISAGGKVTAKKDATGTCTVTATATDDSKVVSNNYTVTIASGEITAITLSAKSLTLFPPNTSVGAPTTADLSTKIDTKGTADTTLISWASNAPAIASVDANGKITAKAPGKATITCTSTDGSNKKATCTVNVNVPMSKLFIGPADSYGDYYYNNSAPSNNKYIGYIAAGKGIKMSAKYTSNYGTPTDKKVTWSSSNTNILTVDKNGKVTANKNATIGSKATITATAADGSKVTSNEYNFTVTPAFKKLVFDGDAVFGLITDTSGIYPPYFTATVSGGKNPGLRKGYDEDYECYYLDPIPGQVTTNKTCPATINKQTIAALKLTKKDALQMTVTAKLRDGSGLTAKYSIYAVRFNSGDVIYVTF